MSLDICLTRFHLDKYIEKQELGVPVSTLLPTAIPDPTEGQHASGVSAPWTGTKPGYPEETSENKAGRGSSCMWGWGLGVGVALMLPGAHASWLCLRPFPSAKVAWEPGSFLPASS